MDNKLLIYNTLSRTKEVFTPLHPNHVGMYVCGPTVYGDPHLGHARPAITFDILFRYLTYLGYKVRYVRNITDVGHLENDADEGEDKIAKKARLEQLEPMEIAQYYTDRYHKFMDMLNVRKPSIEPRATAHIIEQKEVIQKILNEGFAYESMGSIYFDVEKYNAKHSYGILSGRVLDELKNTSRDLDGQQEKRNTSDFALWKKGSSSHIMKWGPQFAIKLQDSDGAFIKDQKGRLKTSKRIYNGFPGWHLECTAMSFKYLGKKFDIHGGGLDLLFPHHECEIAQATIALGNNPAKYWMHNNMITINGQKMGKSLGNFITLQEMFDGSHKLLDKAYSPMTVRFFILQSHYRSVVDFSNKSLFDAEKNLEKLEKTLSILEKLKAPKSTAIRDSFNVNDFKTKCFEALNDDLQTVELIAILIAACKSINMIKEEKLKISDSDLKELRDIFTIIVRDILGLTPEKSAEGSQSNEKLDQVMQLLFKMRRDAKAAKDFATSDRIRDELQNLGFVIKDEKESTTWEIKE
jgi:cysteinyl-tRNA synthetase